MLKQLNRNLIFNLNKITQNNSTNLSSLQKFYFSGGHHSGSDSDHDHHHHTTTTTDVSESEDHLSLQRNRIFRSKVEKFSVDSLLDSLRSPISQQDKRVSPESLKMFKTDSEYINFLATNFEKHALKRYPDYKTHLSEFKDRIIGYDKFNAYQKEVMTLEHYLIWKLEKLRDESVNAFDSKTKDPLENIRKRFEMVSSK